MGGSTTNDFIKTLEVFLLSEGIEPEFYESEYNRFWQDAMFENPELAEFSPDIIYIHTSYRNIASFLPEATDAAEDIDNNLSPEPFLSNLTALAILPNAVLYSK